MAGRLGVGLRWDLLQLLGLFLPCHLCNPPYIQCVCFFCVFFFFFFIKNFRTWVKLEAMAKTDVVERKAELWQAVVGHGKPLLFMADHCC